MAVKSERDSLSLSLLRRELCVETRGNDHTGGVGHAVGRGGNVRRLIAMLNGLGKRKVRARYKMLTGVLYPGVCAGVREVGEHGEEVDVGRQGVRKDGVEHGHEGDDALQAGEALPEGAEVGAKGGLGKRVEELDGVVKELDGGHGVVRQKQVVEPVARGGARARSGVYQLMGERGRMRGLVQRIGNGAG